MLELRPGDRAVVTGLGAAREGQVCVVGKYREKRSGFKCVLETKKGKQKCFVNPTNLRLESWVVRQREKAETRAMGKEDTRREEKEKEEEERKARAWLAGAGASGSGAATTDCSASRVCSPSFLFVPLFSLFL